MKILRLLPLLAIVCVAAACTRRPVRPRFETVVCDTLVGTADWGCRVEYRFASIRNAAASGALEAIEKANIGYFFQLEAFDGTAAQAVGESLAQIGAELLPAAPGPAPAWSPGELSVESEGVLLDTLLCYTICRSSYLGGAHGMYTVEYHNYSLAGGYELSAADLFGEERMQPLAELIRQKIRTKYEAEDNEELAGKGFFPEYIDVTDNMRLAPDSVTFYFNPYEIGCYALGPVEVSVAQEEVRAL